MSDVRVDRVGQVAKVEFCRPPNNFFDEKLIDELANAFEVLDTDSSARSILLCSEGKNFCAGADFSAPGSAPDAESAGRLYHHAIRLFRCTKPVIAAVQGTAVGGGLGLALVADFRVAAPGSRFAANFNRIGLHPGFGLSTTLPRIIGPQLAALLFYTGRRIGGDEARAAGLVDLLVPEADLRAAGLALAAEIAEGAPLAVSTTRATLRQGLADVVAAAIERELGAQGRQFQTEDFQEGVRAATERRMPLFFGR